jgi:hypothetical protein
LTQRLCGLQVDDQLELARLHDWQVGRLVALENPRSVVADLTISVSEVGSVAHQPPGQDIFPQFIHRRDAVMGRERNELLPSAIEKRISANQ